jgi:hypothetical protein
LRVAKQIFVVPAGKNRVQGRVVYNYKVSGTGQKVSAALITPACGLAIGEAFATDAVANSVVAFVPTGWGKVAVLILSYAYDACDIVDKCVPTKLKYHVK